MQKYARAAVHLVRDGRLNQQTVSIAIWYQQFHLHFNELRRRKWQQCARVVKVKATWRHIISFKVGHFGQLTPTFIQLSQLKIFLKNFKIIESKLLSESCHSRSVEFNEQHKFATFACLAVIRCPTSNRFGKGNRPIILSKLK